MKPLKLLLLESTGANTGQMQPASAMVGTKLENGATQYTQQKPFYIIVHSGRYEENKTSHPLRTIDDGKMYHRVYGLNYKGHRVYWFDTFAKRDHNHGIHVGMSWKQRQRFHLMQGDHWIQKEENIRYIINIIFLLLGATLTIKSLFFGNPPHK